MLPVCAVPGGCGGATVSYQADHKRNRDQHKAYGIEPTAMQRAAAQSKVEAWQSDHQWRDQAAKSSTSVRSDGDQCSEERQGNGRDDQE
jgi:hypothetical protein